MKLFLHIIGTIAWGIVFSQFLQLINISGYDAGYMTGIFLMMYYWIGIIIMYHTN